MTGTVRPARPEDVPSLREIARAAYLPFVPLIGAEPPPMQQDFAADIQDGAVWVCGEPVAGYVVARPQGADWLIENLAVLPNAHGRGLGRILIGFAEAQGRERGFARAVLYTNLNMAANLTLYPHLPAAEVEQTSAADYLALLAGVG